MGVCSERDSESASLPVDIAATLHNPKTIQSLPKEILINIFEEVYLASCERDFNSSDQLADPTLFPSCIANVCDAWSQLVQSVAHFSTRLIIFVDEPVSFTKLRTQFLTSKEDLINVYVIRKVYGEEDDAEERPRVEGVMRLLVQHIKRCRVVVFDLLHNSSLPRISNFSGKAAKLLTLRMRSRRSGLEIPQSTLYRSRAAFLCPKLQYLDFDGRIFMNATNIPGWSKSLEDVSQKQLTIRNMGYSDGYDLHDFLTALSKQHHFTSLKLVDVELDSGSCFGKGLVSIFIQNFEFEGLSRGFIAEFFRHHHNTIEISHISFTRCELGDAPYIVSWRLSFCDIAPEENIIAFIRQWDGFCLDFKDCPGLNDEVLVLASSYQRNSGQDTIYAPTFRQLEIRTSGPIPITFEKLKELVDVRQIESERHDIQYKGNRGSIPLPMHSIFVSGIGTPLLASEIQWFDDKVDYFTWQGAPAPSDSPILSWDCSQLDASEFVHLDLYFFDPPLPPVSQTPAPDTPAVDLPSHPVSQTPAPHTPITGLPSPVSQTAPASSPFDNEPPSSQPPAPDSPIIDQDYSDFDWTVEDLEHLP